MKRAIKHNKFRRLRRLLDVTVLISLLAVGSFWIVRIHAQQDLKVTANFNGQEVSQTENLELKLSRTVKPDEGKVTVFLNETDITPLVKNNGETLTYSPAISPLPAGENLVKVYLAVTDDDWKEVADFKLLVKESGLPKEEEKTEVDFTPNVQMNLKGENTTDFFPLNTKPERPRFTDTTGQGSFHLTVSRTGWNLNTQMDFVGSSRQNEALRFGDLGVKAPQVDLSSYLIQLEKGRFKAQFGHVSFGSSRHLINNFSSRGINVTVPLTKKDDISFGAANGTSIVGFGNLGGISRAQHSIFNTTYGRDFLKEAGGLRFEITMMRGSLLPITNFNDRAIVDAETNFGGTIRLKRDISRFRFDAGFTRSRFTNPVDPLLQEGVDDFFGQTFDENGELIETPTVVPQVKKTNSVTRNGSYAEISYDIFQGYNLLKNRPLRLTATYRYEELQPLFRSVAAFLQADRRQHQFEVTGGFGDLSFTLGNLRDRDNLGNIPSILKTYNRNNNINLNFSLGSLLNPSKPSKFLPRIGYTVTNIRQFGAFIPREGDFTDVSQVPDQATRNHNFGLNWQFSQKFGFNYQHQRSLIDNRQIGREGADFRNTNHGFSFNFKLLKNLSLSANTGINQIISFERLRTDRTFNLGTTITWQNALFNNSTFLGNFNGTVSGDTKNIVDNRNGSMSLEWSYKKSFGKEDFKKIQMQFFVRYNNRYGNFVDRIFRVNNFNKRQTFNFGLTFNIF
ncbi:MAG: hypothetical protein K1X72_18740 [Pyrinomonadaceae bacterium]|nr:hypothetical protein [Pyrinomonadaceae bacterium]